MYSKNRLTYQKDYFVEERIKKKNPLEINNDNVDKDDRVDIDFYFFFVFISYLMILLNVTYYRWKKKKVQNN